MKKETNTRKKDNKVKKIMGMDLFCNICDATFKTQRNLNIHTNSVHKVKNKPINSEETFQDSQTGEKEHLVVHKPIKCNICNAPFKTQQNLKFHTNSVHEGKKPFKCNICGASFARTAHLNIQGQPLGIDIMYLVLADRNMQVRLGLKVVWES